MMTGDALTIAEAMIVKIAPLYGLMLLGFIYGRLRPTAAEPVSFLQIYFMVPLVTVTGIANLEFQVNYLLLPIITYLGCCVVALAAYWVGRKIWNDSTPNIFSYASGCANVGYYGIPVALIVFPPETFGIFMMSMIGFTLFEGSLGYYLVARGHFTVKDSLKKLVRLPILYAFTAGVVLSAFGMHVPDALKDITRDVRGCYVTLGALMIGFGLSRLQHLKIEGKLIAYTFSFKFIGWPLLALALIALDRNLTHLFAPEIHKILFLLSVMPLPANAIAFALQLNIQPDKASTLVFISTLFALIYVPLAMAFWG
ncbi:MAG TPA: AEC family transporter [Alphaproteobacteria bacterium]|nr:AEC family transporter [Alphaproteobacteria bacterium]